MHSYLFTWAIENRHGTTTFFSEAVKCDDWEQHVAQTIRRQQDDGSGRYTAPWRLVLMAQLASNVIVEALADSE